MADTLRDRYPPPWRIDELSSGFRVASKGIVSKLGYQPYRSGKNPGWVKVKCRAWREANKDRWEIFEKREGAARRD